MIIQQILVSQIYKFSEYLIRGLVRGVSRVWIDTPKILEISAAEPQTLPLSEIPSEASVDSTPKNVSCFTNKICFTMTWLLLLSLYKSLDHNQKFQNPYEIALQNMHAWGYYYYKTFIVTPYPVVHFQSRYIY